MHSRHSSGHSTSSLSSFFSSQRRRPPTDEPASLVRYYDPIIRAPDSRGRTLDEILGWNDVQLEREHDYIQTMFPLPEPSGLGHYAPLVDEDTVIAFRCSPALQGNLARALERMLSFYGFDAVRKSSYDDGDEEIRLAITPKQDPESRRTGFQNWFVPMCHNHLRITRIIRSLRVLGLGGAARDFCDTLAAIYEASPRPVIKSNSIAYWHRARTYPLHIAPDHSVVPWLEKYEDTAVAASP